LDTLCGLLYFVGMPSELAAGRVESKGTVVTNGDDEAFRMAIEILLVGLPLVYTQPWRVIACIVCLDGGEDMCHQSMISML
jgi:hypothetical protein